MVESSSFGYELVAFLIELEFVKSLCYKLRMFGITLDGPDNGFCDNELVFMNATFAESQPKNKHQSI